MSIYDMTINQLQQQLTDKNISSYELTKKYLERIEEIDPVIHAYITVTPDTALEAAKASDERRAKGELLGSLDGIPMALKDIFCTDGILTTCASKILANFVPPYNATCWQRLADVGAVLLGKCNLDEFAMGSSTENSAYYATRNPFDIERTPGGSSGGSAAAVAADLAAYTLGTDTGGSVRQPAHYCGVVGIKPTYGLISRFGIIPYASSLDQAGVFAKNVYDCATVLEAVSGHDEKDSTSTPYPIGDYRGACQRDVKGMKIGMPKEFFDEGIDPRTIEIVKKAAEKFAAAGAEVIEVSLPHTKYALPAYYILACAEASSNLARYDGVRYGVRVDKPTLEEIFCATRSAGFGEEVKRRILLGTYALSSGYYDAYYNKTLQVRTLIKEDYDKVFASGIDCLLTPVTPGPAFKLGEMLDDPLTMYMTDVCTVPINIAGLASLVVPFADIEGLPVGVQLIGAPFSEEKLFTAASAVEVPRRLPPDILKQATEKGVER